MEKWLIDAKGLAKDEAKEFVENMCNIAEENNLEPEWFIEEVIRNIHKIKES